MLPDFERFWQDGFVEIPAPEKEFVLFEEFRSDPGRFPLDTESGRIEIFSGRIASFHYPDCAGHPKWFEPREWLGSAAAERFPLHLLSAQPETRLHSQLDDASVSRDAKIAGREPILINSVDAKARGISDGAIVRVFNGRGSCLAGASLTDDLIPGVVQLATGAWYDPVDPAEIGSMDKHGNPNVLTRDVGTSLLGQGSSAQSALVEVELWRGQAPAVTAHAPPVGDV
jgi:biotin/methionine sulfoxide reductase